MSNTTNSTAALTRNFLVDTDDLVDELLSGLKACDWKDLKMQYQVGHLQANKVDESDGEIYELQADWSELDEEVQLRIAVSGTDTSLPARQQECMDVMNSLFPNDIFRKVNEEN